MSAELVNFSDYARREPSGFHHRDQECEILYLPIIKIKAPHVLESEDEVRAVIMDPEGER